jgi:hypothetical protein
MITMNTMQKHYSTEVSGKGKPKHNRSSISLEIILSEDDNVTMVSGWRLNVCYLALANTLQDGYGDQRLFMILVNHSIHFFEVKPSSKTHGGCNP